MPICLDSISPGLLAHAATVPDLDEALRLLQDAAGIRHGDVAGQYFCFMDAEHSQWFEASTAQRVIWLKGWIEAEKADLTRCR